MAIEFRLLGDVEAHIDGRPVDVGHARQRCVLVALLVDANRPVPVDQLLDRVWADRMPQRAHNALSGYLSRLRRVLSATAETRITRQSGGYLLTVDPLNVDLHLFGDLVARARAAGYDSDAADLFGRALALWRGEAFATLDTPWVNAVRDSLDVERFATQLDAFDLALAEGEHIGILSDLSACATAHPLDERLAGQLMLALYRSGRQAEALERYEHVRLRLADELGADPSPPLRHLHQQILTADQALAVRTVANPAAPLPVPHQLPAPPPGFTGRTQELSLLDAALAGVGDEPTAVAISAVTGTAGVGKTALAVHWAHQVADSFVDGQLYVNLRGFDRGGSVMTSAEAVRGFLHALHVPPQRLNAGHDTQVALYRSLLAGRRMLVVLDNARDAEQVRPLLPGAPGCLVLVTSRNQLTGLVAGEGAHPLTIDLPTAAEARDLLARRLGPQRVAAEPDALTEIIARCGRLPLALSIVAARAATRPRFPLAAVATSLRDCRGTLEALSGADPTTDVRAVFSWSVQILGDQAAQLFRLLGLHHGPDISTDAVASLAGLPPAQVRPLLAELAEAHLVTEHRPGRYAMHDLLCAYGEELAETLASDRDRRAAMRRNFDHYLHTAYAAARLLEPERDPIRLAPIEPGVTAEQLDDRGEALAWLTAEHAVLLAAVEQAAEAGFNVHAWQLPWSLTTFLHRRGHWHDWAATQRTALAAGLRLADQHAQAEACRSLAHACVRLGRDDEALSYLRRALDLFGAVGDHAGQGRTHIGLSWLFGRHGRHLEALSHDQAALDLFRTVDHRIGEARALNNVGWHLALLGDYQQGLACCERALTLHREIGDCRGEADTLDTLGFTHHHLGQHQEAMTCHRQALKLFRDLGDQVMEAQTLASIGDTHWGAGDLEQARRVWHQALTLLDELDHPEADEIRAKLAAPLSQA